MKKFLFASATLLAATNLAYANDDILDSGDLTSSIIGQSKARAKFRATEVKKVTSQDDLRYSPDSDSDEETLQSKSPSASKKAVIADKEVKRTSQVASKPSSSFFGFVSNVVRGIGRGLSAVAKVFGF